MKHPLALSIYFGTLADGPGSYPLGYEAYPSHPFSQQSSYGIRSLTGFGRRVSPLAQSVLYLHNSLLRLCLNSFRREPAISWFDWPFTPTHTSSTDFLTSVGADLQYVLPYLHPGHG